MFSHLAAGVERGSVRFGGPLASAAHARQRGIKPQRKQDARVDRPSSRRAASRFYVLFKPAQVLPYSTNNARFEELAEKASYKRPWANAQRCLIPAIAFDEPCWESGQNIWWQFKRRDGALWGLAGLWNTWTDHATGELHESYTMLTVNADSHPLMNRMHKPDPKYAHNEQDKRSVVSIERHESDQWRASFCGCTTPTGCHVY